MVAVDVIDPVSPVRGLMISQSPRVAIDSAADTTASARPGSRPAQHSRSRQSVASLTDAMARIRSTSSLTDRPSATGIPDHACGDGQRLRLAGAAALLIRAAALATGCCVTPEQRLSACHPEGFDPRG